jgi:hypothetical protein
LTDQALSRLSPNLRLYFYELMIQPISSERMLTASLMKNIEFREIQPGDPDLDRIPIDEKIIASRFAQGAICLGTYKKGDLIGYIWFSFYTYQEDEIRCTFVLHPGDQSVFDFDLYLFPEHRLGLGFVSLWDAANQFLENPGVLYTCSRLTRFNVASRRAHDHLGWRCVGRCVFLKLWMFELMFSTLSSGSRVQLDMRPDVLLEAKNPG